MTKNQVVREIQRRCKSFGVKFDLRDSERVEFAPGLASAGFFDDEAEGGPELVVAAKLENTGLFLGVLLHEYSHVTQWVENCTIWQHHCKLSRKVDLDGWLNTNRKCTDRMREAYAACRDMEADCERRTVRLIKELDAPLDIGNYIQRANSYVHFYNTIPETNRWYHPQRTPYNSPEVTKLFRSDKIEDSFERTPKKQFKALVTCADHERTGKTVL